ncbi:YbhB/YbcL family Raf kinase inhibitor-like protein [Pyrofollis japonicus]|uniref:YbhB/YbcL family Raf kinase inhibitor-like protein n=1 Tax=Pyrofollis japonicus TaxID=3060460 RepID=UPI00295BE29A|nr:YbhB/YbcL family Raf kinase inhibitor-like protein [Pyrofollis japonicus]BEP17494.1 YbhB/YbcL family Raf kinase inhibitor-like protein [Pyrofollis japonicus]
MLFGRRREYLVKRGKEFVVRSPSFENSGRIPVRHTCDGEDVSPRLEWSGAPENTKSYVLIMYDPDAPVGTFIHWVLYNIPGTRNYVEENVPRAPEVPGLGVHGVNDFGFYGYGGPCPPRGHGEHRYFFALHALDISDIGLGPGAKASQVIDRIKDHVIGYAVLMGRYSRG